MDGNMRRQRQLEYEKNMDRWADMGKKRRKRRLLLYIYLNRAS
jgi:hypothetical protein